MNGIYKARWSSTDSNVKVSMPITKIDQQNRLVSGFATLDNTDSHDEIVLATASASAFERFRGNLREMHQPIAAGKMVGFTQESYYDTKTEKFYEGIYATVYVSLGAPNTWEKVLDGTLTGFSIGGEIIEAESQYVPELNKTVRFIKDYELVELSLVDNPANQLANVFSITKSVDGPVMEGMITEVKTENVFYCSTDEIVKTSTEEAFNCPICSGNMNAAGWFEYSDSNKTEKLMEAMQKFLPNNNNARVIEPAKNEGGVDVEKEKVEKNGEEAAHVVEETPVAEEGKAQSEVDSSVENVSTESDSEAANVSEVEDAGNDLEKMFEGLKSGINESLEKNATALNEAIGGLNSRLDGVTSDVETKNSEVLAKCAELSKQLEAVEARIGSTEKSLTVLDGATALKKSSDLGGSTELPVEKSAGSVWGGHFLGADSLQD